ncbi:MAG: flavin reductase [Defluviitaleaceae bacterium]|nr:flavin reductase [Defluviitaleaceae bacterium]
MQNFIEISPRDINDNVFNVIANKWMLVTAEKDGKVNTMTASWGGLGHMWHRDAAFIVIRPQRFTKEFIDSAENFSLTFFNECYKEKLRYLGVTSGRDEDKIKKAELTVVYDGKDPYFSEGELTIICRKLYEEPLKEACFIDKRIIDQHYPEKDFHVLYVGEILKVLKKA